MLCFYLLRHENQEFLQQGDDASIEKYYTTHYSTQDYQDHLITGSVTEVSSF
jgi:hypothetical protein